MRKYIIQFMNHENGLRTDEIVCSMEEFTTWIGDVDWNTIRLEDYILVLASMDTDLPEDQASLDFEVVPVHTVRHFLASSFPNRIEELDAIEIGVTD